MGFLRKIFCVSCALRRRSGADIYMSIQFFRTPLCPVFYTSLSIRLHHGARLDLTGTILALFSVLFYYVVVPAAQDVFAKEVFRLRKIFLYS